MSKKNLSRENYCIISFWVIHISGALGLLSAWSDLFLMLTPVNLLTSYILLTSSKSKLMHESVFFVTLLSFVVGYLVEYLGVNYGLIFGDYNYGANLGSKLFEVPIIIGLNWAILVLITYSISIRITNQKILTPLLGAILMVLLDVIIEQVADSMDFWYWVGDVIPIQNYIGWFVVALVLHAITFIIKPIVSYKKSLHLYLAQATFFLIAVVFYGN